MPEFVIFDIRALLRSALGVRVLGWQKLHINDGLSRNSTGLYPRQQWALYRSGEA